MSTSARIYTFTQVADEIGHALGYRPAESTIRNEASLTARGTNRRIRLTAGLPPALPDLVAGRRVFSADAIDDWLSKHPRRIADPHVAGLTAAPTHRRGDAVTAARDAGMSWQQIADVLGQVDGRTYSRQWAHQKFRRRSSATGAAACAAPDAPGSASLLHSD